MLDTKTYTYGDENGWGDLLTGWDGSTVTSDEIGNITNDGTWEYTWEHGRQFKSMTKSGLTVNSEYDAFGMRSKKTYQYNNGIPIHIEYTYNGDKLVCLSVEGVEYYFNYDSNGLFSLTVGEKDYYYAQNAQGDVVAIVSRTGEKVVEYSYDAWGNVISKTGRLALYIGDINPFRYRGYFYDDESDMYYLQSRYYNPEMGRFICADGPSVIGASPEGLTDKNLFAYCDNNPVTRKDDGGNLWYFIVGGLVGALVSGFTTYAQTGDIKQALISAAVGGVTGVIAASGLGMLAQAGLSALTAGIGYGVDYAQSPLGYNSWAGSLRSGSGISPIIPGFGEMMKGFFGSVDDALVYMFCE